MRETLFFILLCLARLGQAQIGIGTPLPHASAMLEVNSANKGVLVPRIALTAANVAAPVSSPADALLVYNTAAAGTGANTVSPGFYYWNASAARWAAISGSSAEISGNSGFGAWGDCATNANIGAFNPVNAADGVAGDALSNSVALSGNFAIVAAIGKTVGSNDNQGAVYIYQFADGVWSQFQKLTAPDGAANDNFGIGVSISGNYAIVGAYSKANGANANQGAAYIYQFNGSSWVFMQKLLASDGAANDRFGSSVSLSVDRAIVGAYTKFTTLSSQGAAYVFALSGGTWLQQAKLLAGDPAVGDFFGISVAISGNRALVGARNKNISGRSQQGAAYVFLYNGSAWVQQQRLTAADGAANDNFGGSVSLDGDQAVIGASYKYIATSYTPGAVYNFQYNGATWRQQQRIVARDALSGDVFGTSVSLSGNYLLIGASNHQVGTNSEQGAAYLFQNYNGYWRLLQKITDPMGEAASFFGQAAALHNKRFLIGSFGTASQRGMAFFGKVN